MRLLRFIILLLTISTLSIQGFAGNDKEESIQVQGTVVDESGEPLAGVAIRVQGYGSIIYTDLDGQFSVQLPKNGKLNATISTISYKEKQIELAAQNADQKQPLKITLEPTGGL